MSHDQNPWRLCVAPMMDWTDRHCRYFHRLLAPRARLYTEMVAAAALTHDRLRLLEHSHEEHPVALQLGGAEPDELAHAARHGLQAGYDEINLNVGCPSDRVQSGRFGACLMREPERVADCVRAMIEARTDSGRNVPVTVKCRLGVDEQDEYVDLQRFAERMIAAGVRTLVVHARKAWLQGLSPKQNRDIPPLNYERVHRLKRELPQLRVVINGGIAEDRGVQAHLQHVDGVMLGRLAYHDPYALARVDAMLFGGEAITRERALRAMRPYIEAELARGTKLKHVARHLLGLYHGQPGGRAFRRILGEGAHRDNAGWETVEAALEPVSPVGRRADLPSAGI